ncbi:MAG: hypothetical protein WCB27_21075 [Thermoguttaceae bacterium]
MGDIVTGDLVLYVAIGAGGLVLAFGIVGAALARSRGRGTVRWSLFCLLSGPLGLLILVCLPKVRSHPVWRKPNPKPDRASAVPVDEDDTATSPLPAGDGELRRGDTPFAFEPADEAVDGGERSLPERRITRPEAPLPQAPRSALEVELLEPQTTAPEVPPPQTPRSTLEVGLPEPRTTAPEAAPPQAPRSTPAAPVPRRGRVPGVPTGYPDFQVLARRETKIELQCPNCSAVFRRPNSLMGRLEKCPECRAVMRIPM